MLPAAHVRSTETGPCEHPHENVLKVSQMKSRLGWKIPAVNVTARSDYTTAHTVTASSDLSDRQHFTEHGLIECHTSARRLVMPSSPVAEESVP